MLLILGSGCTTTGDNIEIVNGQFSISKQYRSLNEVIHEATDVIEAEVLDQYVILHHQIPFTISEVKLIADAHKGTLREGDMIQVLETGGVYEPFINETNKRDGRKLELTFEGVRVMKPGEAFFLALKKFEGPQIEHAYVPIGEIFGKFKVKMDQIVHEAPDKYKLRDMKPMNKSQFLDHLQSQVH